MLPLPGNLRGKGADSSPDLAEPYGYPPVVVMQRDGSGNKRFAVQPQPIPQRKIGRDPNVETEQQPDSRLRCTSFWMRVRQQSPCNSGAAQQACAHDGLP